MRNEEAEKILARLENCCDMSRAESRERFAAHPRLNLRLLLRLSEASNEACAQGRKLTTEEAVRAGVRLALDYVRATIRDLREEHGLIPPDYDLLAEKEGLRDVMRPPPKDTSYAEERDPDDFDPSDYDSDGYSFEKD